MKNRYLLFVPLAGLITFFVVRLVAPGDAEAVVNRVSNIFAFAVAATGCFAAAAAFARGDYLRIGWHMQGASSLLLCLSSIIRHLEPAETILFARASLTFISNVTAVVGAIVFARAYHVAGIALPWSRGAQRAFRAGMAIVALAAAGPAVAILVPLALGGDISAWIGIFSAVGDFVVLALIAPIFMTAVALRGGLLLWPWGLFTAATFCWLFYDAQDTLLYFVPTMTLEELYIVTIPLRILACTLVFVAGLAQRRLTLGAPETRP